MVDMATLVRRLLDDSVAGALQTGVPGVEVKSREKWRQVNQIRRRSRFVVRDAG